MSQESDMDSIEGSIESSGNGSGIGGGNGSGSSGLGSGDGSSGNSGLDSSGSFGNPGGPTIDLGNSPAGPNPGSPTIAQVLEVMAPTALVLTAITGAPFDVALAGVAAAYGGISVGGPALDSLISSDPTLASAQLVALGGASN